MITLIRNSRLLLFGLILTVMYFSQVYPSVHFHHSHGDQGLPLEISLHPIDIDPDHSSDHHEDDHHHHSIDQDLNDWYRARHNSTTITTKYVQAGSALNVKATAEDHLVGRLTNELTAPPVCAFCPLPSIPRGPPALA
jgi:hypothetical protein